MAKQSAGAAQQATALTVVTVAFATLMGLLTIFDAVRAGLVSGSGRSALLDAGLSVAAGVMALGSLALLRRERPATAAWLLVLAAALRVILASTLSIPWHYTLIWPLYLLPIVMAQVLIGSRAGLGVGLGCLPMFVFTYAALGDRPEATAYLPEAACANALLYLLGGSLVFAALARMTAALRRSDKLVSSHERARAELRERDEQFTALADSSATGILIHQDGHLVYGNPAFFTMAKCLNTDCFGLSLWDFFSDEDVTELQAQLARRRAFGTDTVPPNQIRFHPQKGPARWCEVAVAEAVYWQRPAIVANILDVTDRVEAQEAVRRERDFSNNIINTAAAIIMVLDAEGRVVLLNPAGERLSGYSQQELSGRHYWDYLVPAEYREANIAQFERDRTLNESGAIEGPWESRDGEELTIAWRYVKQVAPDGSFAGIIAVGIDVTQQRMLERQAMVTERLRSLGQIAGGVAHDLNNMLAGIMGPTDLLLLVEDHPERERALKSIMAAATRGAETVRRIQSFSKARTELDRQVFDLRELTEDVIFSLRPRWKDAAQREGVRIEVHDEVPPGLIVHASAGEIGNVIMNLIVNACEAMAGDGEITVTGMQKGDLVQFHVADTGCGMSPETMEQIFQPFFSTKGADNSGLGLAVIHGIILRHGGTITVDSTVGRGTTFTVTLPAQAAAEPEAALPAEPAGAAGKLRLLVVDDVPDVADYLVAIARRAGHEATAEYAGSAALTRLQKGAYDVLITDYGMEGISGPALAERAHALHPEIRLVLVTGWDVSPEEFPLFSAMLKKPCTRGQIEEMLDQIVSRPAGPAPASPLPEREGGAL